MESAAGVKPVLAYKSGSGGTHQFLFDQATAILRNDGYKAYAGFLDSVDPVDAYGRTYRQVMIAGSDDHDNPTQALEHYMDPMNHQGLDFVTLHKSAGTVCQERFLEAVLHWQVGNYHEAIYDLGWAAHFVQDLCVPHHAWMTYLDWHSEYESWVNATKEVYAVSSGGIYSFSSFPDRQYYPTYNSGPPPEAYYHYDGESPTAYDWVDFNAHESIKYFLSVDSYASGFVHDAANPYAETVHPLPDNSETQWVINTFQTDGMQLHFEKIDMESGFDFIRIYDENGTLLDTYTGVHGEFWTPTWYDCGDMLEIETTTDGSVQSWGYKIKEIKYYDTGEDLGGATSVLLRRAQRTTAGFIKFFFDSVLSSTCYLYVDGRSGTSSDAFSYYGDSPYVSIADNYATEYMKMADAYQNGYSYAFTFQNYTGVKGIVVATTLQMQVRNQSGAVHDNTIGYLLGHEPGWYFNTGHEMNTLGGQWQWFNYSVPLSGWGDIDQLQWMYGTGEGTSGNAYLEFDCVRLKVDIVYELHDIAVINATCFKTVIGRGFTANVSVLFANKGDFLESFNVTTQANNTLFGYQFVQLPSSSSNGIMIVWNTTGWNVGRYIVSSSVDNLQGERNTSDNVFNVGSVLVTIPGDIDGDLDVDIFDVVRTTGAYGTKIGQPLFTFDADIDNSGAVNIFDVVLCTGHYGEKYP